ncbi:hypothetical protein [Actinoplanes sp. G11-F43]|uniref:hypothetical protein n=1 Tax=Actinoplanes sp. G11-F43 TaxID=3424130 RepID=UPI003D358C0E
MTIRRPWLAVALAAAVAVPAWLGLWWLAIPRYEVCAMVMPAPAGCRGAARVPAAAFWSAAIAALFLGAAAGALTGRRRPWATLTAALFVVSVTGFLRVLYWP